MPSLFDNSLLSKSLFSNPNLDKMFENFDKIFVNQLENYANSGDLLCAFSCSGNSKNILNAINYAKKIKCKTVLLTGFNKKKIKGVDVHLNIGIKNYGISEDIFQSIMHMISQYLRKKYSKNNLEIF